MSQYFLKPYECFGRNVKVELDLSNYATISYFQKQQVVIHQNVLKRLA